MSHTPGPWSVVPPQPQTHVDDDDLAPTEIWGANGSAVVTELGRQWDVDARLIAAAPDLLAALKAVLPIAAGEPFRLSTAPALLDAARAAIAKAEGKPL